MACPEGIEPPTTCLEGRCSIQLSYGQIPVEKRGPEPSVLGPQAVRQQTRKINGLDASASDRGSADSTYIPPCTTPSAAVVERGGGGAGAGRHLGGLGGLLRHELLLAAGAAPVEPEGRQHPHPGSPLDAAKAGQAAGTSEKQIQQHHRRVQTGKVSTLFPRRCFAVCATVKHPRSILWGRKACSERTARATDC